MDSGSGGEQNYWPGFVDALSNVVLTLIFVLVIFVFALAMSANKVEEKMKQVVEAEKIQQEKVLQVDVTNVDDLRKELEETKEKLAALQTQDIAKSKIEDVGEQTQRETSEIIQNKEVTVQKEEANLNQFEGAVSVEQDKQGILSVGFPETVSKMDEKSEEELSSMISGIGGAKAHKITIKSVMGAETFSAAQRTAYYRAVNVRNFLITKLGVSPAVILSTIVKPDSSGIGRVEIIFKK